MKFLSRILPVTLIAGLIAGCLTGCCFTLPASLLNQQNDSELPNHENSTPVIEGSEVGNLCPDFEMPLYFEDGNKRPSDSRGKITVVNFWYLYCSACVRELQTEFPDLRANYGDKIEIVVVHSYEEYGANIPDWINTNLPIDAGFVYCRDVEDDKFFKSLGGTSAWPITIILDEEGVIQYKVIGSTTYEEMSEVIDRLLCD